MRGKKLLVVDDDPDVVIYLSSLLEDHGFLVESARDSRSALAALDRFRPDVVLIDVLMPGKSGLDLLVTLRADQRHSTLPVVMITGSDQVLEDGCASYIGLHHGIRGPDRIFGKPIDVDELLAGLNALVA